MSQPRLVGSFSNRMDIVKLFSTGRSTGGLVREVSDEVLYDSSLLMSIDRSAKRDDAETFVSGLLEQMRVGADHMDGQKLEHQALSVLQQVTESQRRNLVLIDEAVHTYDLDLCPRQMSKDLGQDIIEVYYEFDDVDTLIPTTSSRHVLAARVTFRSCFAGQSYRREIVNNKTGQRTSIRQLARTDRACLANSGLGLIKSWSCRVSEDESRILDDSQQWFPEAYSGYTDLCWADGSEVAEAKAQLLDISSSSWEGLAFGYEVQWLAVALVPPNVENLTLRERAYLRDKALSRAIEAADSWADLLADIVQSFAVKIGGVECLYDAEKKKLYVVEQETPSSIEYVVNLAISVILTLNDFPELELSDDAHESHEHHEEDILLQHLILAASRGDKSDAHKARLKMFILAGIGDIGDAVFERVATKRLVTNCLDDHEFEAVVQWLSERSRAGLGPTEVRKMTLWDTEEEEEKDKHKAVYLRNISAAKKKEVIRNAVFSPPSSFTADPVSFPEDFVEYVSTENNRTVQRYLSINSLGAIVSTRDRNRRVKDALMSLTGFQVLSNGINFDLSRLDASAEKSIIDGGADLLASVFAGKEGEKAFRFVMTKMMEGKIFVQRSSTFLCFIPRAALRDVGMSNYQYVSSRLVSKELYLTNGKDIYWAPVVSGNIFLLKGCHDGMWCLEEKEYVRSIPDQTTRAGKWVISGKFGNSRRVISS